MTKTTRANRFGSRSNRPRRLATAGAVLTVAALTILTGCAAGGGAAGGSSQEAADGPVTLNFAWWGDASRAERYEAAIDLFEEKNPNITIQTGFAGFGDYWTSRNTEAASRSLPDVFQMDLAYLNEYASFEHISPLDDYFGDAITVDTIDETLVDAGEVNGQNYGLASSSSSQAMIVNGPLLEQLGVDTPTEPQTWDEYDEFLTAIGEAGAASSPVVYGSIDYTQYFWAFQVWLGQQDKQLIDGEELGFDKDDLADWWSRSEGLRSSAAAMPAARLTQISGVDPLGSGETASDISWDNFLARCSEGPAAPELTLLAPPADDDDNTGLFLKPGLMLSIGANSENPVEAAAFIDFLVNDPEVGNIFGMSRGVPSSSSARDGIEPSPLDEKILAYEESIADSLDGTAPTAIRGLGTLEQTFVAISEEVSYGSVTVDEAVDRWFTEAENAVG
jgi:multiple sugar transport system substrate-binding protein